MKLWGGRFTKEENEAVHAFNASISFDQRLWRQDIRGSLAHVAMLKKQGIIPEADAQSITEGLEAILADIEAGTLAIDPQAEDIHSFVEAELTERIGEAGKRLHTGRSRNDQVGLSFRLHVADCMDEWRRLLLRLMARIGQRAEEHRDAVLPGCTHMQPAQPVSLAHHLLAYAWMLRRYVLRIEDSLKRVRVSPLGAAALAGTTYPLDPESVAAEVGFGGIYENSMDAVSDRDFVLEALFDASVCMEHLSRLCEEIIIWANPSFGFVSLSDGYSTGSSIMPQKKNPDVAELMRGKTGRVYGALMGLLTVMKGMPLAYNRDLQEDKEGFLDASRTLSASLAVMEGMLAEIGFNTQRMEQSLAKGFLNATEMADYLVGKGIPFREAHHITGRAVALAESRGLPLEALSLDELQGVDGRIGEDVYAVLDYRAAVRRRETPGGTGPGSVARQLQTLRDFLAGRGAAGTEAEGMAG